MKKLLDEYNIKQNLDSTIKYNLNGLEYYRKLV